MQQLIVVLQYATYSPHPFPQPSFAMHLHEQVRVSSTKHGSSFVPSVVPGGVKPPPKPDADGERVEAVVDDDVVSKAHASGGEASRSASCRFCGLQSLLVLTPLLIMFRIGHPVGGAPGVFFGTNCLGYARSFILSTSHVVIWLKGTGLSL